MDIFVIKTAEFDHIPLEELKTAQKKEISDARKLREHCLAYYLAEKIARETYGLEGAKLVYKGRKPVFAGGEKFFSISHSKEYIALAYSDFPCGIDIEKITERDYENIAKRMKLKCRDLESFYEAWTEFEAVYKLSEGVGTSKTYRIGEYILTAVSAKEEEEFQIFYQLGKT